MKTIEFNSWHDFRVWVEQDRQGMPVYWRGQKDPSWPLASAFERMILEMDGGRRPGAAMIYPYGGRLKREGKRIWSDGFYQAMRDRYLAFFKRASAGLRGANPAALDEAQWWALGRHFGLVTPLLDWSESPYIAAFFPMYELLPEIKTVYGPVCFSRERKIAIYRLFHNPQLEGDGLRVIRPTVEELGRMHGQQSVFTWLDSEDYFDLQGFLDSTGRGDLLTRITIDGQAVSDGLRDLQTHGITYRLLFPDLFGAAMQANVHWDSFHWGNH